MPIVLHLLPAAEWERLAPHEPVTNPSLSADGFIHCTDAPSVMLQVASAFYADRPEDFVVLHVDAGALSSRCVWEAPAPTHSDAPAFAPSFPHVYGPIDRAAVIGVQSVERDESGAFVGYGVLQPVTTERSAQ